MLATSLLLLAMAGPPAAGPLLAVSASTGTGCVFRSPPALGERMLFVAPGQWPATPRMSLRCRRIRQLQTLLGPRG